MTSSHGWVDWRWFMSLRLPRYPILRPVLTSKNRKSIENKWSVPLPAEITGGYPWSWLYSNYKWCNIKSITGVHSTQRLELTVPVSASKTTPLHRLPSSSNFDKADKAIPVPRPRLCTCGIGSAYPLINTKNNGKSTIEIGGVEPGNLWYFFKGVLKWANPRNEPLRICFFRRKKSKNIPWAHIWLIYG